MGCMVSEITRFYCKTDMTSSWFLRQGALHALFDCRFWKGDPNFIILLHWNFTSVVHRFPFNELFMLAGNDVKAISSLGSASGNFWLRILKVRPRLYIHVQLTLFVYLERFRRYSIFLFGCDFPTGNYFLLSLFYDCTDVVHDATIKRYDWTKTDQACIQEHQC